MAAQLNYGYSTPKAIPGAKADLSVDVVVSRRNEENDGVLKFGMAVAVGTTAGKTVKVPTSTSDAIDGVFVAAANTEQDMEGNVIVKKGVICDVMKTGHIWGRISSVTGDITYGATAYVVCDGDEAGCFTTRSSSYSCYVECESTDDGAAEVVASGASTGEINLASVTPVASGYTPAVGDYVKSVQIHGSTKNIGAVFGNEQDAEAGISIIYLK